MQLHKNIEVLNLNGHNVTVKLSGAAAQLGDPNPTHVLVPLATYDKLIGHLQDDGLDDAAVEMIAMLDDEIYVQRGD